MTGAAEVRAMSYPEFVAFLEQENAPPGGSSAVSEWVERAPIRGSVDVLDLACSTGFSGRSIAESVPTCRVFGVDICSRAVAEARRKSGVANMTNIEFAVGDAGALPTGDQEFDVVVAGCCFGFFADRKRALEEVHRVLRPLGRLCIANFTYSTTPPDGILDLVHRRVGFRPEADWSAEYWRAFFGQRFVLEHEAVYELDVFSSADIAGAAAHLVRNTESLRGLSDETKEVVFQRLLRDRLVFNEHRKYQARNVQVWRRVGSRD